jgi:hypothetical protein
MELKVASGDWGIGLEIGIEINWVIKGSRETLSFEISFRIWKIRWEYG